MGSWAVGVWVAGTTENIFFLCKVLSRVIGHTSNKRQQNVWG